MQDGVYKQPSIQEMASIAGIPGALTVRDVQIKYSEKIESAIKNNLRPPGSHIIVRMISSDPKTDREGYIVNAHALTRTYDILFMTDILLGVPERLIIEKDEPEDRDTNYGKISAGGPQHMTDAFVLSMMEKDFVRILRTYERRYSAEVDQIVAEEEKFEGNGPPPPPKRWIYSVTLRL